MPDTIERTRTDKVTEPSKRWRIRFRAPVRLRAEDRTGRFTRHYEAGEIVEPKRVFPSKELADERAYKFLAENIQQHGQTRWEYLGAFPVTP